MLLVLLVPCPLLHPHYSYAPPPTVLGPHGGRHRMACVVDSFCYVSDNFQISVVYQHGYFFCLLLVCGSTRCLGFDLQCEVAVLCCELILLGLVAPPGRWQKHKRPAQITQAHLKPPLTSCLRISHQLKQITWPSPNAYSRGWYYRVTGKLIDMDVYF